MSEQQTPDRVAQDAAPARDPEAAQRSLARVQHLLERSSGG